MSEQYQIAVDCVPLMRALSKMAGMEQAGIKRMILELSMEAIPTLYVESYMRYAKGGPSPEADSVALPETPLVIKNIDHNFDTTSIQNKQYRTYSPRPETDLVGRYVQRIWRADTERLEAEARVLLASGFEVDDLTIAEYPNGTKKVVTKESLASKE